MLTLLLSNSGFFGAAGGVALLSVVMSNRFPGRGTTHLKPEGGGDACGAGTVVQQASAADVARCAVLRSSCQHIDAAADANCKPHAEEQAPIRHVKPDLVLHTQYLALVRRILDSGSVRIDRTGVGTFSTFGAQLRFDLRESFPLLTTKSMFFRAIVAEMLWMVSGKTDARILSRQGIKIWDKHGSRQYLDSIGLNDREENDLGPVYGFQWRHFGAKYTTMHADYRGQGTDQLAGLIDAIKRSPNDRRLVLTTWNPADLGAMSLPPCPCLCQFHVSPAGELSCGVYQRSADMGLGLPFDIAAYALLTCLVAHACGLAPGELVHTLGDAHVYKSHAVALREQIGRSPRSFPRLRVTATPGCGIDDITAADVELTGYEPHGRLPMPMAV